MHSLGFPVDAKDTDLLGEKCFTKVQVNIHVVDFMDTPKAQELVSWGKSIRANVIFNHELLQFGYSCRCVAAFAVWLFRRAFQKGEDFMKLYVGIIPNRSCIMGEYI